MLEFRWMGPQLFVGDRPVGRVFGAGSLWNVVATAYGLRQEVRGNERQAKQVLQSAVTVMTMQDR